MMTSRRLLKLALNTAMESQVDVSCGNSPDSCVDSSEGRLEKTSREGNIHASASTVQNANQLNFSDDSDYEYFDDSEADRDYNPLVDKESSSEDECQEDIKRYVVVPQTPLTSKFCKVTPTNGWISMSRYNLPSLKELRFLMPKKQT